MPENLHIPGKTKPTEREVRRSQLGKTEDWRFPEKRLETGEDKPGHLYCPRCHAVSVEKRWFLDEKKYHEFVHHDPSAIAVLDPGCERIEKGIIEGEVTLHGSFLVNHKEEILNRINNEEKEDRENNPISRLASVEDRGEEIYILTTTQFLAERIGKEIKKAYDGELEVQSLPREKFSRVRWSRN